MRPYRKFRLIGRCASALVVFALLLLAEPGLAQDPEPNDDFATAAPLSLPAGPEGCIDPATDIDFYVFSVPDGASPSVSATSASRELFQLDLFDGRQRLVASGTGFLELRSAAGGDYFLRVSFGSAGCYRLAISAETPPPPPPPPTDPFEPNDDFATAVPIRLPTDLNGCIDPATDLDFYTFAVPEGARIEAFSSSESGQVFDLALFDAQQQLVAVGELFVVGPDTRATAIIVPTAPAGEYFVRVSSASTGCYGLGVRLPDVPPPPGGGRSPVADAGRDQRVNEGSPVTLDGRGSFDEDGDRLTYQWDQTAGPTVTLSDPRSAQPAFTAPAVGPAGVTLTFALTVSDGTLSATDSVDVVVENVNHPPRADAGADQTRTEGSLVTLDGSASADPDGDALTYTWTQTRGPVVTLSDAHHATPTFTAPPVDPGGATLAFQLVVSDGAADSRSDEVVVTVQNVNDPPRCDLAQASQAMLWPPNHKLILVSIAGVTDPDNQQVTINVTVVTQDEPVNGLGDADTSPDAVLQGGSVLLRAERSGTGNGRIYAVHFMASDTLGGTCTGTLTVGVPHSTTPGVPIIDDSQFYDSTQP